MRDEFVAALLIEIQSRKKSFTNMPFSTLYFGGGSPSLLSIEHLHTIVNQLYDTFSFNKQIEFTIELNPDQVTREYLVELKHLGVTRVSVGVQSFNNKILKYLGRIHSSQQALDGIHWAHEVGFNHISIDLIYAIPERVEHDWQADLDIAFSLPIDHLSAYNLTIEENSKLYQMMNNKKRYIPNELLEIKDYSVLLNTIKKNGFLQYEISNYCKNKAFSKHNSNYWTLNPYLGLGPSAHSFNGKERQWNVTDTATYIHAIKNNKCCWEKEGLSISTRYNEYVMLGLRTVQGVDLQYIKSQFGDKYLIHFERMLQQVMSIFFKRKQSKIILTPEGLLIADNIITKLFYD